MLNDADKDIIYALAISPDFARDRLCFAARHSGLWRSVDGATTWQLAENPPGVNTPLPATSLAISADFAADGCVFMGVPGGILHSTDGGNRWTAASLASPPPFVSALAVSPNYPADGIVFAATLEDGVFRSTDRAATWQAWNFGLFDLNVLSLAVSPGFAQDRIVYVGADSGIFYSRNGGRAWRETGFPTDFAPVLSLAISPRFAQDGMLLAGTESSGLFHSHDKGQTWQRVLDSDAINAILLSPAGDVLAVSNDILWLSCDGGQSWANRYPDGDFDKVFVTAALAGSQPGSSVLLGLSDGQIVWASL